ncbi:MAG: Holliday junction resolvase RuvX [Cellulomonadaceae bacterium]
MSSVLPRGARLGVDYGQVRVGVAASDPDGLMATPVETLRRDLPDGDAVPADVTAIAQLVHERAAVVVYVGLPRHLSGSEGEAARHARSYALDLARHVDAEVRLVDERMSTVSAHSALYSSGRAGRKHRAVVDQAAAVVILQSALDRERTTSQRAGERVTGSL